MDIWAGFWWSRFVPRTVAMLVIIWVGVTRGLPVWSLLLIVMAVCIPVELVLDAMDRAERSEDVTDSD